MSHYRKRHPTIGQVCSGKLTPKQKENLDKSLTRLVKILEENTREYVKPIGLVWKDT